VDEYFDNLDGYLAEFGITVNRDLVVETDVNQVAMLPQFGIATLPQVLPHEMMGVVDGERLVTFDNRSISFADTVRASTEALLRTSSQAYAKADMLSEIWEREPGDASGPFYFATLTTIPIFHQRPGGTVIENSRILTMGSSVWLMFVLDERTFSNRDFLIGSLNYLNERETRLMIRPTPIVVNIFDRIPTEADVRNINIIIWAFPFLVVLLGIFVFLRRRKL